MRGQHRVFARACLYAARAIVGASSQLWRLMEQEWARSAPGSQRGSLSKCLQACSLKGWAETRDGGQRCSGHPCNSSCALCSQVPSLVLLALCLRRPPATHRWEHVSPAAPDPAGDHAVLCKGLLAVEQREGCWGCWATSGLQPLPDSQGLGVDELGSERGAEWQCFLLGVGEKNPVLWDCWQRAGALSRSRTPGSTHTALFCIHLLSPVLRQAATFPGLLAAQPGPPWQGEDGGRTAAARAGGRRRWRRRSLRLAEPR